MEIQPSRVGRGSPLTGDVPSRLPLRTDQVTAIEEFLELPRVANALLARPHDLGSFFRDVPRGTEIAASTEPREISSFFGPNTSRPDFNLNTRAAFQDALGSPAKSNPLMEEVLQAIFYQAPRSQGADLFRMPGIIDRTRLSQFLDDFGFSDRTV